jgi:divalent metal cation (Fe/Co/Zn/Cd) transporter
MAEQETIFSVSQNTLVLLMASIGYELTGIGSLDSIGTIIIAWLSFREGREEFQKAAGEMVCGCQGECH